MYIEYKDPNRRMLFGGELIESKAKDKNAENIESQAKGPTRRRQSQRMMQDDLKNTGKVLDLKEIGKKEKSIFDIVKTKEVEIVKGLFKMVVYETILPTFTIMRVIELKLISDSLGQFQNILEKKRKGEFTLADQIVLGFNPDEIDIDVNRNFIIQIDKSVCLMKPKKNRLPKELEALEGHDESISGEKRYQFCKFIGDTDLNKNLIYYQYLTELNISSSAYKKCLFQNQNDRKRAYEKMSSIQSMVNQNILDNGTTQGANTVASTKSVTFEGYDQAGLEEEIYNKKDIENLNTRLNKKLHIFDQAKEGGGNVINTYQRGQDYMRGDNIDGSDQENKDIYATEDSSITFIRNCKLLDNMTNSKPKSKNMLSFFRAIIKISLVITAVLNFLEVQDSKVYLEFRKDFLRADYYISEVRRGVQNIQAKFQINKLIFD